MVLVSRIDRSTPLLAPLVVTAALHRAIAIVKESAIAAENETVTETASALARPPR